MIPHETDESGFAVLGGGCFWCLEAVYVKVAGVRSVTSGYAGGKLPNPTYEQVCGGATGHAEVVLIEYDPAKISFSDLLSIFWKIHDPTTLNRQGADVGTQYRSTILYLSEAQRAKADASSNEASAGFPRKIVTKIEPLAEFYPAEEYHQHYFERNPNAGYCRAVIKPKVDKLPFEIPTFLAR